MNNEVNTINDVEFLDTPNVIGENNLDNKKRRKKKFIIIGIVLGVIVLIFLGIFIYIKVCFSAQNYIENKMDNISLFIDEIFEGINYEFDKDYIFEGNLDVKTDVSEFSSLNNTNLDFTAELSYNKQILNIYTDLLKDNEDFFDSQFYVDENNFYINSDDLYPSVLYTSLDESIFNDFGNRDIKDIFKSFFSYLETVIVAADVNTEIKGLNAIYTYNINSVDINKLNELIDSDNALSSFLSILGMEDITDARNVYFEVSVSLPSAKLEDFRANIDGVEIKLNKINNNNYEIVINDTAAIDVNVNNDEVTISLAVDDGELLVEYNKKTHDFKFYIREYAYVDDYIFNIEIYNNNDDEKNIIFDYSSEYNGTDLNIDLTTTKTDDNNSLVSGTMDLQVYELILNLDYEINVDIGDDLVKNQTFSNIKDINSLTRKEDEEFANNMFYILNSLDLAEFSGLGFYTEEVFLLGCSEIYNAALAYFENTNENGCISVGALEGLEYPASMIFGTVTYNNGDLLFTLAYDDYMIINSSYNEFEANVEEYDIYKLSDAFSVCYQDE